MAIYAMRPDVSAVPDDMEEIGMPPLPAVLTFPAHVTANLLPLRDEYRSYSRLLSPEGYEGFHDAAFWMLLSTIAARRIYADYSDRQYTPLYIAFAARTSLYAKTTTANVVKKVLSAAGLRWLLGADRTTPEKLMSDMAGWIPRDYGSLPYDRKEELKLRLAMAGQIGWINDEFGKFVKGMLKQSSTMANYAELLLTFDSCQDEYRNNTISRSSEPITAPYLSMIGNMTLSNMRDSAKSGGDFWTDGFWARFLFITPPSDTYIDAPFSRGEKPVPASISRPLRRWHERLGSPVIDIEELQDEKGKGTGVYQPVTVRERQETCIHVSDAADDAWKRYRSTIKGMLVEMGNEDLDGSYDRLATRAMRVATLIASVLDSSEITIQHWALAQEVAESWRYSLHQFYTQVNRQGKKDEPTMEDRIIEAVKHLLEKGDETPSARDIAKSLHKESKELKPYLTSLARDGVFQEIPGRQAPRYKLVTEEETKKAETKEDDEYSFDGAM